VDLSGLTGIFVGAHVQLAQATHTPEIAIEFEEGDEFLKRAQAVMSHYSIETTQKTIDWLAFWGVASMMYGTRAIAIRNRHRDERAQRGEQPRGQVIRPLRFRSKANGEAPAPVTTMEEVAQSVEPDLTDPGDFEL